MNEKILELFLERPDLQLAEEDCELLRRFFMYLDRNSLWLRFYEPGDDPVFLVSDDTIRYRFPLSEIRKLWDGLKQGKAIVWEERAFEYISRSNAT